MHTGKVLPLGNLEIHPLSRLTRVGGGRGSGDPLCPSAADLALAQDGGSTPPPTEGGVRKQPPHPPSLSTTRMFELDSCQGNGKGVVVINAGFIAGS